MIGRITAGLGVLAVVAGAALAIEGRGYARGISQAAAATALLKLEIEIANTVLAQRLADLVAARAARIPDVLRLENDARSQVDSADVCLSDDGVRRLSERWRFAPFDASP